MRIAFLLSAALLATPVMADELVAYNGADSIHLAEGACTSEVVLSQLDPTLHGEFRAAYATLQGRTYAACWRMTPSAAHLVYEDGDQGLVPFTVLKPLVSI